MTLGLLSGPIHKHYSHLVKGGFTSCYFKDWNWSTYQLHMWYPAREFVWSPNLGIYLLLLRASWFWSPVKAFMKKYMILKTGMKKENGSSTLDFSTLHYPLKIYFSTNLVAGDCYFQVLKAATILLVFACFFHFSAFCLTFPSSPKDSNLCMTDAFWKEFGKWISVQFWCKSLSLWGVYNVLVNKNSGDSTWGLCEVGKKWQNNSAKMYFIFKAAITFCP